MRKQPAAGVITFYHDIEQNIDSDANPEECLQALRGFLKLEKKYEVPVTYNVVGKFFREQPELISLIQKYGHEVAFHSYSHDCSPENYANEVRLCREVSSIPCGYRSPRSEWNQDTLKALHANGFLWNAEKDNRDGAYFIYNQLVRLPIATDDWALHTGGLSTRDWVAGFSELLECRGYFGFGSHDCVASFDRKERLKAWENVLQAAIKKKAVLINFSEAAESFRRATPSGHRGIAPDGTTK